jgi:hypothetical protein
LIVPGRYLVMRGTLTKICRKSHKQFHFFLFNDILIYARDGLFEGTFILNRQIPVNTIAIKDLPDDQNLVYAFQILSTTKSFTVYAETWNDKKNWLLALKKTIQEFSTSTFTAPVWIPDDSFDTCMNCEEEFTLIRRRHHCRLCGWIICKACSSRVRVNDLN